MRNISDQIVLLATDLSNFLNCRHRTALELGEARGKRTRPQFYDPLLEALFARGLEHELRYIEHLEASGRPIVNLGAFKDLTEAIARTVDAIRSGADVIVQGALQNGTGTAVRMFSQGEAVGGCWGQVFQYDKPTDGLGPQGTRVRSCSATSDFNAMIRLAASRQLAAEVLIK